MKSILIEKRMKYKGITLEPGWFVTVPEIEVDPTTLARYAGHFQKMGATPAQAHAKAREVTQASSDGHYVKHIKMFVGAYAVKYKARFGDLKGFRPSEIQAYYVPFDTYGGRGGHAWVNPLFAKMRNESF